MAKIAAIQEYGAHITVTDKMRKFLASAYNIHLKPTTTVLTIPPRAHRRTVMINNMQKWQKMFKKIILKNKDFDMYKSLSMLGMIMVQDYKAIIKTNKFQELSDMTLKIREIKDISGSQPLYATGEMERQITAEIIR